MGEEKDKNPTASALIAILTLLGLWAAGTVTAAEAQQTLAATVDYFLKIDGIESESTDDRHKGEIEVLSWSWGDSQSGGPGVGGGGGGAGKVSMQDFRFTATYSKASPLLFLSSANGRHIKEVTLSARKSGGGNQQDYLIVKMSDVLITSYQTGVSDGNPPMDQVSLSFSRIEFEYRPQNPDGSVGAPVKGGWDVKEQGDVATPGETPRPIPPSSDRHGCRRSPRSTAPSTAATAR